MGFANNIKDIRKLVYTLTGKDSDVSITYRGTDYGISKPWKFTCNARELEHEDYEVGAEMFLKNLKKELMDKISSTERQAQEYRKILGAVDN